MKLHARHGIIAQLPADGLAGAKTSPPATDTASCRHRRKGRQSLCAVVRCGAHRDSRRWRDGGGCVRAAQHCAHKHGPRYLHCTVRRQRPRHRHRRPASADCWNSEAPFRETPPKRGWQALVFRLIDVLTAAEADAEESNGEQGQASGFGDQESTDFAATEGGGVDVEIGGTGIRPGYEPRDC